MQTEAGLSRWTPYALSALRIFVGLTFFQHGTHKYFNFPPGQSYQGINLGTMHGWAGTIELIAGALILIGLFTRPAAFIAAGEMAVGYFVVHAPASFFTAKNGGGKRLPFLFRLPLHLLRGSGTDQSRLLVFWPTQIGRVEGNYARHAVALRGGG